MQLAADIRVPTPQFAARRDLPFALEEYAARLDDEQRRAAKAAEAAAAADGSQQPVRAGLPRHARTDPGGDNDGAGAAAAAPSPIRSRTSRHRKALRNS